MPDKLRLGLVGSGGWAGDFLVPAILSHEAAALTAVCGRTRERAVPLAARSGAAVYTDYQEMIDDAGLDAVVVATPEDLHHPVVMAALAAGLHVLCEKPLAYTAEQSGEMLAAADRAGVKHMVQFTNRGLPHYRYVKQLLDDGYIGRPYHASFSWATGWAPAAQVNPYSWPADAHRSTGAVGELGAHIFDLARWFFGEVVRVSASLKTFVPHDGPDGQPMETANDSACVLLDFASGAHATVHLGLPSIVGPGLRQSGQVAVLCGSEGTLETQGDPWAQPPVSEIIGIRRGATAAETLTVPSASYDGTDPDDVFAVFRRQSIGPRLFIDAILQDRSITPSFADGHQVQRIVEAALVSQRTGRAQAL